MCVLSTVNSDCQMVPSPFTFKINQFLIYYYDVCVCLVYVCHVRHTHKFHIAYYSTFTFHIASHTHVCVPTIVPTNRMIKPENSILLLHIKRVLSYGVSYRSPMTKET